MVPDGHFLVSSFSSENLSRPSAVALLIIETLHLALRNDSFQGAISQHIGDARATRHDSRVLSGGVQCMATNVLILVLWSSVSQEVVPSCTYCRVRTMGAKWSAAGL